MSDARAQKNKQLVDRLFKEVMHESERPNLDVLDEVIHEDYIQHNPLAGQGRAGLRNFIENVMPTLVEIEHLFRSPVISIDLVAEGDLVVRREIRKAFLLVDIFRIEGDRIREHWEAWHFETDTERPAYMKS